MTAEKHPAEVALAKLRDFPEYCEAHEVTTVRIINGVERQCRTAPIDFRKYARPIIDEYFAAVGGKLCRQPVAPPIEDGVRESMEP